MSLNTQGNSMHTRPLFHVKFVKQVDPESKKNKTNTEIIVSLKVQKKS